MSKLKFDGEKWKLSGNNDIVKHGLTETMETAREKARLDAEVKKLERETEMEERKAEEATKREERQIEKEEKFHIRDIEKELNLLKVSQEAEKFQAELKNKETEWQFQYDLSGKELNSSHDQAMRQLDNNKHATDHSHKQAMEDLSNKKQDLTQNYQLSQSMIDSAHYTDMAKIGLEQTNLTEGWKFQNNVLEKSSENFKIAMQAAQQQNERNHEYRMEALGGVDSIKFNDDMSDSALSLTNLAKQSFPGFGAQSPIDFRGTPALTGGQAQPSIDFGKPAAITDQSTIGEGKQMFNIGSFDLSRPREGPVKMDNDAYVKAADLRRSHTFKMEELGLKKQQLQNESTNIQANAQLNLAQMQNNLEMKKLAMQEQREQFEMQKQLLAMKNPALPSNNE